MKKTLVTLGVLAIAAAAQAQVTTTHKLTRVWETEAALKTPESVRFDAARKVLYVSNIDGEPWTADGKGSIAKIGLDGKVIAAEWVTGLDCPKGLALSADGKWLYAADAGGIVVIDIAAGKIKNKIAIPDGVQLNDLVNDKGTLYVSDSKGKKVFVVKNGKPSVFLDEKVLNGLGRRGLVRARRRLKGTAVRRQGREDQHRGHRLGPGDKNRLRADVLQEHRDRIQGRVARK
jgi:hypothetical protein